MNNILNSDSEQCTESKLSPVHSAPTLDPAYAHTAPYRRPGPAVSQAPPAVLLRPRAHWRAVSQAVCCVPCRAPYRRVGHRVARPLSRIMALPSAMPRLSRDTTQRPSRVPVTIRPFVSRHNPPNSQALTRAPLALRASRPYHYPCCLSMHACCMPCVLLCHDTVCCIMTKPRNWVVAHSNSCNFFFFHSFFFLFVPSTRRP